MSKENIIRIRIQRYLPERRRYEEILGFTITVGENFFAKLPEFEDMVKKWLRENV